MSLLWSSRWFWGICYKNKRLLFEFKSKFVKKEKVFCLMSAGTPNGSVNGEGGSVNPPAAWSRWGRGTAGTGAACRRGCAGPASWWPARTGNADRKWEESLQSSAHRNRRAQSLSLTWTVIWYWFKERMYSISTAMMNLWDTPCRKHQCVRKEQNLVLISFLQNRTEGFGPSGRCLVFCCLCSRLKLYSPSQISSN